MDRNPCTPTRFVNSHRATRRPRSFRPELLVLEDRLAPSVTSSIFALDQTNSSLTLSGTIGGNSLSQQGSGSLVTHYNGTLVAGWDLTAHTIQFNANGTNVNAVNSGTWQPAVGGGSGSAPADYGAQVTIIIVTAKAAVRDLVATVNNASAVTLSGGGPSYTFPSNQTLTITHGTADYNAGSFGSGTSNLASNSATNAAGTGTFADLGNGAYRITAPINLTINQTVAGMSATLHIIGTVVGNVTLPVVALGNGQPDYSTSVVATHGPVHITDPAGHVTDAASGASLHSMTVTLTNHPDGANEILAADLSGTGLTGSYDSSTGILSITGTATPAVYTTALSRLTYQDNASAPDTHNRIITVTVNDGTNSSVIRTSTVSVSAPAPASSLSVTGFTSPTTAGVASAFTVTARDSSGGVAMNYTGTVHFTTSAALRMLPADYTFTANDHGVHNFSGALDSAGTQSITATDTVTSTITGTQSGIVVNPAAASTLVVTANPTSITAGNSTNVTVTAQDQYGNTATGYTGTIHFTSSDPQATLPADSTLTNGTGTFSATLATASSQSVTATDTATSSLTATAPVTVAAAAADHFTVTTSAANPDVAGTPFDVTVTVQDAYNNTVTSYTGTVHFSSADPFGATLPNDYTFQTTDNGQVTFSGGATLYTAGTEDVTVTDAANNLSGTTNVNVMAGSAVGFNVIATANASSGAPFDVTVVAVDNFGNTDMTYGGTISFTTTDGDPGVVLPNTYTFQSSDAGSVTFSNGVTLITPGSQTITVTDVNSGITGSAFVTVM
jgi:hypothetical protein